MNRRQRLPGNLFQKGQQELNNKITGMALTVVSGRCSYTFEREMAVLHH